MAQLIVALDVETAEEAERVIDSLYELDLIFKVGFESLFGYPGRIVSYLESRDARYFVDAKLHDIPRTVDAAVRRLVRPGVHIIDVHALGGSEMMRSAVEAARERADELGMTAPYVFAVTILTSIAQEGLQEIGMRGGVEENVARLAALARDAGCAGVVSSAQEVRDIKRRLGANFLTLTPGIRPDGSAHGDQKRVVTPAQAVVAGADYLVVGRPIAQAADPPAAAAAILAEMRSASASVSAGSERR